MLDYLMKDNGERETVGIWNDSQQERQTMKNNRQQGITDMALGMKDNGELQTMENYIQW